MRGALSVVVLAALALVPAAGAKNAPMFVLAGTNGLTAWQAAAPLRASLVPDPLREPPAAPYLLAFSVRADGLPTDRAQYFPASGVVCFVARGCTEEVVRLHRDVPTGGPMARFVGTRPTIVALRSRGRPVARLERLAPGLELALAQRFFAREAPRPAVCIQYEARWTGAAARPRVFCLSRAGVWANGLLYRLSPRVFALARA
jgi:hypothetical protein